MDKGANYTRLDHPKNQEVNLSNDNDGASNIEIASKSAKTFNLFYQWPFTRETATEIIIYLIILFMTVFLKLLTLSLQPKENNQDIEKSPNPQKMFLWEPDGMIEQQKK